MTKISFWSRLTDLVSPKQCAVCGSRIYDGDDGLCALCNIRLPRTGFGDTPYDNEMARLLWGRMPVERCAAMTYFVPRSQAALLVYRLKYKHRPETGVMMGRMMAEDFIPKGFFDGIDLLIPVPLTRKRERRRGYNQSLELAKGVALKTGIPIERAVVCRKRFTDSQTQKHWSERNRNVEWGV